MRKLLLISSLLAAGCSPLQQAPLMYTSKQVFGVDISAPTTESTGVSMNLGFKNVDAAYVPIAVSKEGIDTISTISATYGSSDGAQDNAPADLQVARVNALKNAILGEQAAQNNFKSANDEYAAAQQYNTYISTGDIEQAKTLADSKIFSSSNLDKHRALTNSSQQIPAPDIAGLKNSLNNAEQILSKASQNIETTKKELAELLFVRRTDAMSVYGSFGATTSGGNSAINNKLGKMFSTGVAAQNLTEGIARESEVLARGRFLASCIELAKSMEKEKEKSKQIQFSEDCARAALKAIEP